GEASQPVRAVPSGGALYPLELTVAAQRADGLVPGPYHFHPLDDTREQLRTRTMPTAAATPVADAAAGSRAVIGASGAVWRSRFAAALAARSAADRRRERGDRLAVGRAGGPRAAGRLGRGVRPQHGRLRVPAHAWLRSRRLPSPRRRVRRRLPRHGPIGGGD